MIVPSVMARGRKYVVYQAVYSISERALRVRVGHQRARIRFISAKTTRCSWRSRRSGLELSKLLGTWKNSPGRIPGRVMLTHPVCCLFARITVLLYARAY